MKKNSISYINTCNGKNGDNPSELTRTDFDCCIEALLQRDYKTVKELDPDESHHKWSIVPDYFFAFVPKVLIADIKHVCGFIDIRDYPPRIAKYKNEIGAIGNFRVIKVMNNSMFVPDELSHGGKTTYFIDFRNSIRGRSLLRLRCTLRD